MKGEARTRCRLASLSLLVLLAAAAAAACASSSTPPGANKYMGTFEQGGYLLLRWQEGLECLRLAIDEVDNANIDKEFVAAKIQRFHTAMRETGGMRTISRFEVVLDRVTKAFQKKDFLAANAALNEAFALLDDKGGRLV